MAKMKLRSGVGKDVEIDYRIFLNGEEIDGTEYDEILWIVTPEEVDVVSAEEFKDRKILVVDAHKFREAVIMKELGY